MSKLWKDLLIKGLAGKWIISLIRLKIRSRTQYFRAAENIIAPRCELGVRSINASSGGDAASITAHPERGEHIGITALFENASQRSNTFQDLNANDES